MVKRYQDVTNHFGPDAWTEMKESESGAWVDYVDYAALAERCERLEAALRRISTMNAADDSDYGFNEWGEADCFNQTRILASEALSGSSGGKDG